MAKRKRRVFEAAGGFSPTIGIIGAVLGLIQVMKNLANIDEVGHGIAVSFVATVYGVGAANLLFLPAAAKIKAAIHLETQRKEMILEGVSRHRRRTQSEVDSLEAGRYTRSAPDQGKEVENESRRRGESREPRHRAKA